MGTRVAFRSHHRRDPTSGPDGIRPFNLTENRFLERNGLGRWVSPSELLWDQGEAVFARSIAKLFVPAGEIELFAGGKGQGPGEMDGVIGAERMSAGTLGRLRQQRIAHSVDEETAPKIRQIIKATAELSRGQASSFTHPG